MTVYTSDGSLAITMPDEIGKPRSAAVDELVHRGFSRENIRFVWQASVNSACLVEASTPTAGEATAIDSPVTLTIQSGEPLSGVSPPAAACP